MITVVTSVVIIVMATAVLGSVLTRLLTIEIPTSDKTTFPITDPNGTTTIDYPDGVELLVFHIEMELHRSMSQSNTNAC